MYICGVLINSYTMISIKNLGFSYGSTPVLKNITMTLEPGKIYGLLGENGVGKTTLLTLLCGLKNPKEGIIEVDGVNPYKRTPELLGNQFYLADEMQALPMTAEKYARETGQFWPGYNHDKFLEIMSLFENDPSKKMNEMSTGQLKKTYISFALSLGCQYVYLDEPTNGLDIPSKAQFRSALMKYTDENSTIVISTHQVRDLENVIDPIIILDRQEVLLNASIETISSKLYFDYGTELHQDALYFEQIPGGYIQVRQNVEQADSKVNIEALFNAVHSHKELVKNLFRVESEK